MKEHPSEICEICKKNNRHIYSSMCQNCIDDGWTIKDLFVEPSEYIKKGKF